MSKYYKILPENLICRGFQYQEGLNIDTKPIDECQNSYGLHFSNATYIMNFCDYGTMIAEVEIPEGSVVYRSGTKFKADRIILKNIRPLWDVETLEDLIREGVDFEPFKEYMLIETIRCGHLDIAKYLVEQGTNIHAWNDWALRTASDCGHFDIVKYLVEQGADIHAMDDQALSWASYNGYFEIVKYLVEQGANIHANNDEALQKASIEGHFDIVKYLVEQGANIYARDSWAIRHAGTSEVQIFLIQNFLTSLA